VLLSSKLLVQVVQPQPALVLILGLIALECFNSLIVAFSFFLCLVASIEQKEQVIASIKRKRVHNGAAYHHPDRRHYLISFDDISWNDLLFHEHMLCQNAERHGPYQLYAVFDVQMPRSAGCIFGSFLPTMM